MRRHGQWARLVQVAIEGNLKFSTAKLAGFAQTGDGSSALDEESDDDFVEGGSRKRTWAEDDDDTELPPCAVELMRNTVTSRLNATCERCEETRDDLEGLLAGTAQRRAGDDAARADVASEMREAMDTGVRVNPGSAAAYGVDLG